MRNFSNMDFTEITTSSKDIFDGRVFQVKLNKVELPDGSLSSREIVNHPGGASVVALDEKENIYLVEQFRIAVDSTILELPAGKIEKDEDHLLCAKRELQEEIGIKADRWELLSTFYPTPGYCSEEIKVFLARDLEIGEANLDSGEFLRMKKVPLDKALKWIKEKKICDSKTIIGLLLTAQIIAEESNV